MPTVLTDNDSFDTPATVPVDGDAATASSVDAEFQVLQNRTLYDKNRAAEAKALADGIRADITGKLVTVDSAALIAGGTISHGVTSATPEDVPNCNQSLSISAEAGDKFRLNLGPLKLRFASASGLATVRVVIIENAAGSPTLTNIDHQFGFASTVVTADPTIAFQVPITIPIEFDVAHAGTIAFKVQLAGDGTNSVTLSSYNTRFGYMDLLRALP